VKSSSGAVLSLFDRVILGIDHGLRVVAGPEKTAGRVYPAEGVSEATLTKAEKAHSVGLMRVNHAGEVSAQALYLSQAMFSKKPELYKVFMDAASEEKDHLWWCKKRITELGGRTSLLDGFWFAGAFVIGTGVARRGDDVSLGFVEETEAQVVAHLDGHLEKMAPNDTRSRSIIEEMRRDEAKHGEHASELGAQRLPKFFRRLMKLQSRCMTFLAYKV